MADKFDDIIYIKRETLDPLIQSQWISASPCDRWVIFGEWRREKKEEGEKEGEGDGPFGSVHRWAAHTALHGMTMLGGFTGIFPI